MTPVGHRHYLANGFTKFITTYLTEDTHAKLKALAKKQGSSLQTTVRLLLEKAAGIKPPPNRASSVSASSWRPSL